MDPETAGRAKRLTTGQDAWSARCGESRTPGAAGGPWETDGGNTDTAPTVLPDRSRRALARDSRIRTAESCVAGAHTYVQIVSSARTVGGKWMTLIAGDVGI